MLPPAALGSPAFPKQFSAEYTLKARGITVGRSSWSLRPAEDGRYVYENRSAATGLGRLMRNKRVIERSEWEYLDRAMRPLHYRYERTGGSKERHVQIAFDWKQKTVRTTVNGDPWRMALPPGTLDKLVYVLAMMHDLSTGKRDLQYTVADGGKLKTYRVEVIQEEPLETALGTLATLVVRRSRKESGRESFFWCAPSLHFLPVKLEHREKDGTLTALIEAANGFGALKPASGRR